MPSRPDLCRVYTLRQLRLHVLGEPGIAGRLCERRQPAFGMVLGDVRVDGWGLVFLRLRGVDPGFRADRILSFTLDLEPSKYSDPRSQTAYFQQIIDGLSSLPGVALLAC
jgi:hypothetical protein